MLYDSHAHYCDEAFEPDRKELLLSMKSSGVELINEVGFDIESSKQALLLSESHTFIKAVCGIHPHEAEKEAKRSYIDELKLMAAHKNCVAIGEIGLDYHYDLSPRDIQKEVFEKQLRFAAELEMPVVIHSREACADTMELIRKYRPRGVFHCFSYSAETAKEIITLGMYISFTGVVTFKNARKILEAVRVVPDDKLLSETDCPYMAPVPFRGSRCDSSMMMRSVEAMAGAREQSAEYIEEITFKNAVKLFSKSR